MTPPKFVDLFHGNCAPEKVHIWLCPLEGGWKYNTKAEKLYQFEKGLHPGVQANKWWGELKAGEKDTCTNIISCEDLSELVKDEDKTPVMSHIAWAEAVCKFVSEIPNGDADMLLKRDVRNTLPLQLHRLIPNEATLDTWEKWLIAVENISLDAIKDAMGESPTHQQLTSPLSTPQRFAPTPLYPPRTTWSACTDDPFSGSTIRTPNTYAKNLLTTPISPSAGRGHFANLTQMYPTDATGVQQYKTDFETWMSQNGHSASLDYASFPFTAPPQLKKYYHCGLLTDPPHFGLSTSREFWGTCDLHSFKF
ncbi:hypothetical protein DFH08DRAFT_953298 [Mycena albidolilacea]|uniref:Uncharacterized protein n=1 Tax=Mycena albidolilacea TaxID=1033008 RepID=A0AAD7AGF4_9AGAR|nr:hypothetical protein DFH08DRAFT_953298 [Mycena albidolilacea]